MADAWEWSSSNLSSTNLQKGLDRNPLNLVRNGSFESWIGEGASAAPDAWEWQTNGGTLTREGTTVGCGNYSIKMVKTSGDANVDSLWQWQGGLLDNMFEGDTFTVAAKIYQNASSAVRVFISDGVSAVQYSDASTTTGSWVEVSTSLTLDSSATKLQTGFEFAKINATSYVDAIRLTRGATIPKFMEQPTDRTLVCQAYDNDGTIEYARSVRIVPFTRTFALSSVGDYYSENTLTIPAGYEGENIIACWCHMYSSTGTTYYNVHATATTFAAGGNTLVITLTDTNGSNLSDGDYTVKGAYILSGWDDYRKVFN